MTILRFGAETTASEIRGMSATPPTDEVAEIISAVIEGGDRAVAEFESRFSGHDWPARVDPQAITDAPDRISTDLLAALQRAIRNVTLAAEAASSSGGEATMPEGQRLVFRSLPVARAAAYVPGGRGSYPSTAVMCLATAAVAGVKSLCVLSPARSEGEVDSAVLAVCSLLGVDEVYAVGGAQAIVAAAIGTATIEPVDVIVGPGNAYVQEAKRQLVGRVGIDSVAGPSELVVVADSSADPELIALDLLAQAEHGPDSLVVLISPNDPLRDDVGRRCESIEAQLALVAADDLAGAVRLADDLAPEHLQLMVEDEKQADLSAAVTRAGALFVGHASATAFGDYVTGSNHVLPTGGSARYSGALSTATFTRRMTEVHVSQEAADALADAGAAIARGEGFTKHAESMEARKSE